MDLGEPAMIYPPHQHHADVLITLSTTWSLIPDRENPCYECR